MPKKVDLDLDLSGVKYITDVPCYQELNTKCFNRVLYKTVFRNNTSKEQHHTLKANQQSSSSYTSSIKTGLITDLERTFSISIPPAIAKDVDEFSGEILLETDQPLDTNHTLVVENGITVPERSTMSACIQTKEIQREYSFETFVTVDGFVRATFKNKNQQSVFMHTIPLKMVIAKELPAHKKKVVKGLEAVKIEGICKFKYRIKHETVFTLERLSTNTSQSK